MLKGSVPDPDPGSSAFLPPVSGIRIRDKSFLEPGSESGMNDLFDYEKRYLVFMFPTSFYVGSGMKKCSDPDPGWKNVRIRIRDKISRIRNKGNSTGYLYRYRS
jgi:hypothetical protein